VNNPQHSKTSREVRTPKS